MRAAIIPKSVSLCGRRDFVPGTIRRALLNGDDNVMSLASEINNRKLVATWLRHRKPVAVRN